MLRQLRSGAHGNYRVISVIIVQRKQRMVTCKLCGIELGKYQDYDMVLFHAWKYHLDIYETYRGDKLREIIFASKVPEVEQ